MTLTLNQGGMGCQQNSLSSVLEIVLCMFLQVGPPRHWSAAAAESHAPLEVTGPEHNICKKGERLATRAAIYGSLRALWAQIREKSLEKSLFRGLQKVPEITRKSKKYHQKSNFGYFCEFGPGGPGDSCKWSLETCKNGEKSTT